MRRTGGRFARPLPFPTFKRPPVRKRRFADEITWNLPANFGQEKTLSNIIQTIDKT
jgi:hypothetical protein